MTSARRDLVDPNVTRYYHCISRCVRKAFLCGDGYEHRRQWLEDRLQLLAESFAISIAGFAVMSNHFHVALRLDGEAAESWSDKEVLRRWLKVYPPRFLAADDEAAVNRWIVAQLSNPAQVAEFRSRLADLGWFMKALKEPLARMANREDDCRGAFWDGRFKSIAILDLESLLATCAYIDLNPVAAGVAETPETSPHTSIRQRVEHVQSSGKVKQLNAARSGSVAGSRAAGEIDQDHWLIPIEDRRGIPSSSGPTREGLFESFSLGSYLLLVDYTSRLYRKGKARVCSKIEEIFDRLGTTRQAWTNRTDKMLKSKWLYGRAFATKAEQLSIASRKFGVHHLVNLSPQPGG